MRGSKSPIIGFQFITAMEYGALNNEHESTEVTSESVVKPEESTGDPGLDAQVASGVLKGDVGTEAAQVWISAFLIAALGFVVYLYAFSIPLHGDDLTVLGGDSPIARIVTSPEALPDFPTAPLAVIGLALNASLGGGNVDFLHGGSILLHIFCGILVFLIARRLLDRGTPEAIAMLAGMLFVAHPLATESVDYLVARPVLQSSFFGLLGLLLLLRACPPQTNRVLSLGAAVIAFALAFGSDASALTFPLIGVAILYLRGDRGASIRDYRGVVATVLLLTTLLLWVTGNASGMLAHGAQGGVGAFLAQLGAGLYYGLIPTNYDLLPVSGGLVTGVLGLLLLVGAIALGIVWKPLPAMLGFWILLSIAGAVRYGMTDSVGPTRYLYFSWAACCIVVPWLLQFAGKERTRLIGGAVAAVLVLLLSGLSMQRNGLWTRPLELWEAAQQAQPESPEPPRALGRFLAAQLIQAEADGETARSQIAQGISAWSRVLELEPDNGEARKYLGLLALEQQEFEQALEHLRLAAMRLPTDQDVALYIAYAAEQQGRVAGEQTYFVEALRAMERAARLGPLPNPAKERYGMMAASMGDVSRGLPLLEEALKNNPNEALEAQLAPYRQLAQQTASLRAQAEEIQKSAPQSAALLVVQGQRNMMEGRVLSAFYMLQLAMAVDPNTPGAWTLLGLASARLEGAENFLAEWGAQQGGNWEAWTQLATRCGASGVWNAAEAYIRYAAPRATPQALPEIALADIALALNQPNLAAGFLKTAQSAYPDRPESFLRLADMAFAVGDTSQARNLLREAEKRGATGAAVAALNEKLGPQQPVREGITRTVIK